MTVRTVDPLDISRHSIESLEVTVRTTADPTAGDPPKFAVLDPDTDVDPTDDGEGGDDWTAGTWGTWTASPTGVGGTATAVTPTIGAAGAAIVRVVPDSYDLWMLWTVGGSEVPVKVARQAIRIT